MHLKGWSDVMSGGAVAIGGGIAFKQMGCGDLSSGLPLDKSDFNLIGSYNIFLIIIIFLSKYENKIFKN